MKSKYILLDTIIKLYDGDDLKTYDTQELVEITPEIANVFFDPSVRVGNLLIGELHIRYKVSGSDSITETLWCTNRQSISNIKKIYDALDELKFDEVPHPKPDVSKRQIKIV